MDKIKKVVAVLVAVAVSMQTSMMIFANNTIVNENEFDFRQAISKDKIKEEVYENVQDNGLTTVYIWLEGIDQNEK